MRYFFKFYRASFIMTLIIFTILGTSWRAYGVNIRRFPDLSHFKEITVPYQSKIGAGGYPLNFRTSEGIYCVVDYSQPNPGPTCAGLDPEYLPSNFRSPIKDKCVEYNLSSSVLPPIATTSLTLEMGWYADCHGMPSYPVSYPINESILLSPGFKVSLGGVVCAKGEDHMLACTNHVHGFVLRPDDIWLF